MHGPLLLRADASFGCGTGHVMRLIALAEAWREAEKSKNKSAEPILLLGCVSISRLRQRITDAGIGLWDLLASYPDSRDLDALTNLAEVVQPAWIVLDGYHFDPDYQTAVRALGIPLLVLDDMAHHGQYHANLLLNQNVGAEELHYTIDSDTQLLLGPRYCMIRPELQAARTVVEHRKDVDSQTRRLLVTMGGADHRGLSFLALKAVALLDSRWEVKLVVGGAARRVDELRQQAAELPGVALHTNVRNMGSIMTWADLTLSTAGTTTWELAYLGVPTLLVVAADNQIAVARMAAAVGCAVNLGWWEELTATRLAIALEQLASDEKQRVAMSNAGRILLDGKGANRVVRLMYEYAQENCVAG